MNGSTDRNELLAITDETSATSPSLAAFTACGQNLVLLLDLEGLLLFFEPLLIDDFESGGLRGLPRLACLGGIN
jgi:hypothetical protein